MKAPAMVHNTLTMKVVTAYEWSNKINQRTQRLCLSYDASLQHNAIHYTANEMNK